MTIQHSAITSANCHEPKHITDALSSEAGKVITPSAVNGVSELRYLTTAEITGLVAALAAKASLTGAETLTNKRVNPRVVVLTDAATIAVDSDITDIGTVTLTDNRTLGAPTGTPVDGQKLMIRVRQDAGGTNTLAYNAIYRFPGASSPTVDATGDAENYLLFVYHADDVRWDLVVSALDFVA